jgi:hypothetical protein
MIFDGTSDNKFSSSGTGMFGKMLENFGKIEMLIVKKFGLREYSYVEAIAPNLFIPLRKVPFKI